MAQSSPRAPFFRPWAVLILIVMGFFLLLFIILRFDLIPKLEYESICQTYGSIQVKYRTDALEKLGEIADDCVQNGEHEEAIYALKELHKLQVEMFGPKNKKTVETLEILARQFVPLKKYDESLALYWRVYKIKEETLGPTHSETLTTLQLLAGVYHFKGNYKKAAGFSKVVYKQRKILLGPEHAETVKSLLLLATSLEKSDESPETKEKVLSYFKQVYKGYKRTLGENNEMTLSVLFEIGRCLVTLKRFEEAASIFEKIMNITEKMPQSILYQDAENGLSFALTQLGRTEEARQIHKKARRLKNERGKETEEYDSKILAGGKFTPEVEDQIAAVLNLAKVAMAEGNHENALEKLEQLYSIIQNGHPKTQEILQRIITIHNTLQNFKKALEISIDLFHVTQKHEPSSGNLRNSNFNKNEEIANVWQNAFIFYSKVAEGNPDESGAQEKLRSRFKEISEIFVSTLELESKKGDEQNPTILQALVLAASLSGKTEIVLSAASNFLQVLKKSHETGPKPSEEEVQKIKEEIHLLTNILDESKSCKSVENFELEVQNLLKKVEL